MTRRRLTAGTAVIAVAAIAIAAALVAGAGGAPKPAAAVSPLDPLSAAELKQANTAVQTGTGRNTYTEAEVNDRIRTIQQQQQHVETKKK